MNNKEQAELLWKGFLCRRQNLDGFLDTMIKTKEQGVNSDECNG